MKRLIILFYLFPLIIFSQYSLGLTDIKSINSKMTFQKVMLENGFSKTSHITDSTRWSTLVYENETETQKAIMFLENDRMVSYRIAFKDPKGKWPSLDKRWVKAQTIVEYDYSWESYKKLVDEIKTSLDFEFIYEYKKWDEIYYTLNKDDEKTKNLVIGFYNHAEGGGILNYWWDVGVIQVKCRTCFRKR